MPLMIPEDDTKSLEQLLTLDDQKVEKLCDALAHVAPLLSVTCLSKQVVERTGLPKGQVDRLVRVLFSLYTLRYQEGFTAERLAEEVRTAIEKTEDEGLKLALSQSSSMARLQRLLSLEGSFGTAVKGLSIVYDYPRHFHSARILTDARPIFPADPGSPPTSFIVSHTLKFDLHEEGEEREWFLALNSKDLADLREAIDRAMAKEKSLVTALSKASMTVLGWED